VFFYLNIFEQKYKMSRISAALQGGLDWTLIPVILLFGVAKDFEIFSMLILIRVIASCIFIFFVHEKTSHEA